MPYVFTHEDKKERERLAAIEAIADPFTIECLEKIGVGEGWRCLEIGAGGGSIAEWLCGRVGPSGRVAGSERSDGPALSVGKALLTPELPTPGEQGPQLKASPRSPRTMLH